MSATTTTTTHLPPPKPNHAFTRKPESKVGQFFWRRRMWFESTFVLSMLEPWEKILLRYHALTDSSNNVVSVLALLFLLLSSAILKYMPHHLLFLRRRAMYYLWGQEGDERILWQWLGLTANEGSSAVAGVFGAHKEL
ncbi:hypothetical protein JR316_0011440 [Psilocybe cubensis]|uniref:Uncharacterized protein n=1 Tax=Psilocybe cubensis TaxID=181762 RepID=A0ACB8GLI7_PSICU|nr:hypothetical protein JR316_0011440 [Psilocybe cubensis]KAH9475880.1 hypothetical protein JR316_0011440 [Psilocybe cubensis]